MAGFEDIYSWIVAPVTLREVEAMLDDYSLDEIQFFIITQCIAQDLIDDLQPYIFQRSKMFLGL